MQRKIKVRAWDTKGQYFLPLEDDGDYYFRDNGAGLELHNKFGQCKNVILLQYTGLKDKNGKEIYEGDILKCIDNPTHIESGMYAVRFLQGCFYAGNLNLGDWGAHWQEIIGNIYENPELLQPSK